jgi:hypothetical protein
MADSRLAAATIFLAPKARLARTEGAAPPS